MAYQANDRKHVRAAEKAQLASLVVRGEVVTGIMSVPNGRQWMHELLATCHVFTDPFNADPHIHAANSGQRGIGIQLFNDIMTFCPKQFTTMIEESNARSRTADERTRSPNGNGRDQAAEYDGVGRVDYDHDPYRDNAEDAGSEA